MQSKNQSTKPSSSASTGDKRHARGKSTRELILATAERLYAQHGISAVSLRDIASAAGQKNNGAVHYHFGGKDNLVKEIVLYRIESIKAIAMKHAPKSISGEKPPQVADYVSAFVLPFESSIRDDNYYIPFLSRCISEEGGISNLMKAAASTGLDELKMGLGKALPDYPQSTIDERWAIFGMSVIHSLAMYQAAQRAGTLTAPINRLLDDLVRYHTAGLTAPLSSIEKVPRTAGKPSAPFSAAKAKKPSPSVPQPEPGNPRRA